MKKRFLAVLALLVIVPTMIFATNVAITWEWMIDDPQVTGFRYQLNDENSENWVVVSGDTTMVIIQDLEGSAEYSLYLQQTFDGVNWSDSAVSVAYPLFEAEPVIEAPMEEVVVEAPMEEAVVEEPIKEATPVKSRYYTSLGFNLGLSYDLTQVGTYNNYQPVAGMTFGFNNIKTLGNHVGLGIDLDVNAVGYVAGGVSFREETYAFYQDNTFLSLQILLVPELEFTFGNFGIDLGILGGMTLVNVPNIGTAVIDPTFSEFEYGVFTYGVKAGLDYHVSDLICFGLDATATKINDLGSYDTEYSIDGTASLKFTF
jgi:hypothetical protein